MSIFCPHDGLKIHLTEFPITSWQLLIIINSYNTKDYQEYSKREKKTDFYFSDIIKKMYLYSER